MNTRKSRPYFILLERDSATAPWRFEFGDYDHDCVKAELEDRWDHDVRRGNLRIIRCVDARQTTIEATVDSARRAARLKALA